MKVANSGRALLLELLAEDAIPEDQIAEFLKTYKAVDDLPRHSETKTQTGPIQNVKQVPVIPISSPPPESNMPFWAIGHYEHKENEEQEVDKNQYGILGNSFFKSGSPFTNCSDPLWRPGQIHPALLEATRHSAIGNRINTPKLVKAISQGKMPRQLPRYNIKASRPGLWVILDYRPERILFRQDVNRIKKMLAELLGAPGENYQLISVTSETSWGYILPMKKDGWVEFRDVPKEVQILLVSPITSEELSQWDFLINLAEVRRAKIFWLSPVEPNPNSNRVKTISFTERTGTETRLDIGHNTSANEFLLACIAQSWEVCPGLLRALRHLLRLDQAPVSVELEVWQSPKLLSSAVGLTIRQEYLSEQREKFQKFEKETQDAVLKTIDNWHKVWPNERKLWEHACWESQGLGYQGAGDKWLALADFMAQETEDDNAAILAGWVLGAAQHHPAEFWKTDVGVKMSRSVRLAAEYLPQAELPEGIEPAVQTTKKKRPAANIFSTTAGLEISPASPPLSAPLFRFKNNRLYHKQGRQLVRLTDGELVTSLDDVTIESAQEKIIVQRKIKPTWAKSIEQGPDGLFCTLPNGRRLRWCYPDETFSGVMHPLSAPKETVKATWVDEKQWLDFQNNHLPYLPKVATFGNDEFGFYADIDIGRFWGLSKETFRLRWIPPGEFWMGSPEDEPEHQENETRHRVLITQGYWIAETSCSQALWKAVMGTNPSCFKGDDLPVEQISWDDVQEFCQKLNEKMPELAVRLPSEAEWEYACRAGTETPFWWGHELNTDRANYDGNRPYSNGIKGEDRDKIIAVKSFQANPWGLYQMHGNVFEWCEDGYGNYAKNEINIDPVVMDAGTSRVLRGGGWGSSGGWLRAAGRGHYSPVLRNDDLGFRLAAGPRPGGAK